MIGHGLQKCVNIFTYLYVYIYVYSDHLEANHMVMLAKAGARRPSKHSHLAKKERRYRVNCKVQPAWIHLLNALILTAVMCTTRGAGPGWLRRLAAPPIVRTDRRSTAPHPQNLSLSLSLTHTLSACCKHGGPSACAHTRCVYIYIYIYVQRERERLVLFV